MTWLGKLPTYSTMEEVLVEFFRSAPYVDFPIKCICGEQINTFAGISIHMRKKHGVYIRRAKNRTTSVKRLVFDNKERLKAFEKLKK